MKELVILKVRNESNPNSVAGAMAANLREGKEVELHAIGAGAVNQAVKAIIITRGFVAPLGINLSCIPGFTEVDVEGDERTGIKFILKEDK